MVAHALIHLLQDLSQELVAEVRSFGAPNVDHLVHEVCLHELLNREPLAHDERLICLAYA